MNRLNKIILILLLILTAYNARATLLSETVKTIKIFEGYHSEVYRDSVGIYTIGHGLTVINNKKVTQYTIATPSQLKRAIVNHIKNDLKRLNTIKGFNRLNNNQKRALLSLAYNVGTRAIINGSISKGIKTGNHKLITSTISKYIYAGGRVLKGLETRRAIEIEIYNKPVENKKVSKGIDFAGLFEYY